MKREELKELGLSDEQIDKVMDSYGKSVNDLKASNKALEETNKALLDDKAALTSKLDEVSKSAIGNEELTKQINELKAANESALAKANSDYEGRIKDILVNNYLTGKGAKDVKLVKGLFGEEALSKVAVKDNQLEGMDEVFNEAYKNHEYMFEQVQPSKPSAGGVGGQNYNGGSSITQEQAALRAAMGLPPIKE